MIYQCLRTIFNSDENVLKDEPSRGVNAAIVIYLFHFFAESLESFYHNAANIKVSHGLWVSAVYFHAGRGAF